MKRKCAVFFALISFTSEVRSAAELLAPTARKSDSPPGKIHRDTGRTNAESPWGGKGTRRWVFVYAKQLIKTC